MLHVEAETCSSFCRSQLALRRASMVSSAELLERAERAVPEAKYCRDLGFDEYQPSGPVFFGTDVPLPREVPTYELDQTEQQYDPVPDWFVWTAFGVFSALVILLFWAFA